MALSHADLEFAKVYVRAARQFEQLRGTLSSYYAGEWGFRYYFRRTGAQQLPMDESLVPGGSLLALPKLAIPYNVPAALREMTVAYGTCKYEMSTPLRTLDWHAPAGFYSSGWGLVPFSFSREPIEEVEIRQVNLLIERLPWAFVRTSGLVDPWPGLASIQGRNSLALLARAPTSIEYSWSEPDPRVLEFVCLVQPGSYHEGSQAKFTFSVRDLAADSRVLAELSRTIVPGVRTDEQHGFPVRFVVQGRKRGTRSLELSYDADDPNAVGAFAEAVLRPVEHSFDVNQAGQ
jgi:hypothetical protein